MQEKIDSKKIFASSASTEKFTGTNFQREGASFDSNGPIDIAKDVLVENSKNLTRIRSQVEQPKKVRPLWRNSPLLTRKNP